MRKIILACILALIVSHINAIINPVSTKVLGNIAIPERDEINIYSLETETDTYNFFVANGANGIKVWGHKDTTSREDESIFDLTFETRINDFCHFLGYTLGDSITLYVSAREQINNTDATCQLYAVNITNEDATFVAKETDYFVQDFVRESIFGDTHKSLYLAIHNYDTSYILQVMNNGTTKKYLLEQCKQNAEISFPFSKGHEDFLLAMCDGTDGPLLFKLSLNKEDDPQLISNQYGGRSDLRHACLIFHDSSLFVADDTGYKQIGDKFIHNGTDYYFDRHIMREATVHRDSIVFFNLFGNLYKTNGTDYKQINNPTKPVGWITAQKVENKDVVFVDDKDFHTIYTIPEPDLDHLEIFTQDTDRIEFIAGLDNNSILVERCKKDSEDCSVIVKRKNNLPPIEVLTSAHNDSVIIDTEVFSVKHVNSTVDLHLLVASGDPVTTTLYRFIIDPKELLQQPTPTPVLSPTTSSIPTSTSVAPEPTSTPTPEIFTCNGRSPSDPLVCTGRGDCVGNNTCACYKSYSGKLCEITTCFAISSESLDVCSGQGICYDYNVCHCREGYTGYNCKIWNSSGGSWIVIITMTVFSGFCVLFLLFVISYLFYRRPTVRASEVDDEPAFGSHILHDEEEEEDNLLDVDDKRTATPTTPVSPVENDARAAERKSYSLNDESDEDLDIRV